MNEHLKRLEAIWLLLTNYTQLSHYVTRADRRTFSRRLEGEGIMFLTSVLPRLFKALDRSFTTGVLELPVGFQKAKHGNYPLFLVKAWEQIFNEDGTLKPTPDIQTGAVACIRQLSAVFYKLEMQYTTEQIDKSIDAFLQAEIDLSTLNLSQPSLEGVLKRARGIVCRLLAGSNPADITPRHGSGSSACRVMPHMRYDSFRFIPRLHEEFPYDEYFFYSTTHLCDNLDVLLDAEEAEPHARCVLVPKDSRGPRLISCEPREFMYIQQGLMNLLYDTVHKHPTIASQIGFNDQTRNQELALSASKDGRYATLDLKEASDRVSLDLVERLFPENWVRKLKASRSQSTLLPNGTLVPLSKFAPMGSACCFPVEAICFWAISLAAIGDHSYVNRMFKNRLTESDMKISVFGDDIIVPVEHYDRVINGLESVGLVVNKDKSYRTGPFRESCGMDAFNGVDVTPVRVKHPSDSNALSQFHDATLFNNFIACYGYANVGSALESLFREFHGPVVISNRYKIQGRHIEKLHKGLSLYGPLTDVPNSYKSRFNHINPDTSCYGVMEYRIPCLESVDININANRWSQLLRHELLQLGERPANSVTLARRHRIKYSWCTP